MVFVATSSLLFSCTQSCKGLQDTCLWWWHASTQRNSTKFPFRLTLYPTANPLEPLHRAHYPDAHEGRPHHLFRATWAGKSCQETPPAPVRIEPSWSSLVILPHKKQSLGATLVVNVLDLLIFHCLLFKTQDLTWSSQCCVLPQVELCILPRGPSSLQGFGFIAHGTHFNDITEVSWSAANLQCHVAEPWLYRHTDNVTTEDFMALVSISWQEHLGSNFWACDTNGSSLKIQIHLGKHLPSSWQVSQAAFCKRLKKKHLWGLHTKVTFQGDCVSCKELLAQKALVLDNHLYSFLTKKTSMPDWMAPPLQKQWELASESSIGSFWMNVLHLHFPCTDNQKRNLDYINASEYHFVPPLFWISSAFVSWSWKNVGPQNAPPLLTVCAWRGPLITARARGSWTRRKGNNAASDSCWCVYTIYIL